MRIINHNCIIATTCNQKCVSRIWEWVNTLPHNGHLLFVQSPKTIVNGYHTTIMIPDGSKEAWPESDQGDDFRKQFIERLELDNYDDESSPWAYVEVGFGVYGQKMLQGNCSNEYDDKEYFV